MRVVLASGNSGKLRELGTLLAPFGFDLVAQSTLGVETPEETGKTLAENALLKARHAAAITNLPALADDSGIEVAALVDPETPEAVVGDSLRLRQILVNLFTNAIKFTEEGDVVLSVEPASAKDGIGRLAFAVRDTGIGIPADRMDRLFRSFSQVDASITRSGIPACVVSDW